VRVAESRYRLSPVRPLAIGPAFSRALFHDISQAADTDGKQHFFVQHAKLRGRFRHWPHLRDDSSCDSTRRRESLPRTSSRKSVPAAFLFQFAAGPIAARMIPDPRLTGHPIFPVPPSGACRARKNIYRSLHCFTSLAIVSRSYIPGAKQTIGSGVAVCANLPRFVQSALPPPRSAQQTSVRAFNTKGHRVISPSRVSRESFPLAAAKPHANSHHRGHVFEIHSDGARIDSPLSRFPPCPSR